MKKLAQEDNVKESSQLGSSEVQEPLRDEVLELLFGSSSKKQSSVDESVKEYSLEELLQNGGGSTAEECQDGSLKGPAESIPHATSIEKADSQEKGSKFSDAEGDGESELMQASVSQDDSVEAVEMVQQSEFWQRCIELSRRQQWEEINALSSCPSGVASHEARYWWIYSQYQLKEFPVAILMAPLQHLLEGHLPAGLKYPPIPEHPYEYGIRALAHEFVKTALREGVSLVQVYPLLASIRQLFGHQYAFVKEEESVVELLRKKAEYERTPLEKNIFDELRELAEQSIEAEQDIFDHRKVAHEHASRSYAGSQSSHQANEQLEDSDRDVVEQSDRGRGDSIRSILFLLLEGVVCAGALIGLFLFLKDTVFQWQFRSEEGTIDFTSELSAAAPELVLPAEEEVLPRLFRGMLLDVEQRSNLEGRELSTTLTGGQGEEASGGVQQFASGSDTIDMTGPLEPEGLMKEIREKQQNKALLSDEFVRDVGKDLLGAKKAEASRAESLSPPTTIPYRVIEEAAVRKEPSENAVVIEYLTAGRTVHVLKRVGDWLVIVSRNGNLAFLKRSTATVIEPERMPQEQ